MLISIIYPYVSIEQEYKITIYHSYDSMYFFLKDEFLIEFMKMAGITSTYNEEMARITIKPVKEPLLSFVNSIKPHFRDPEKVDQGLIRLKIMEKILILLIISML